MRMTSGQLKKLITGVIKEQLRDATILSVDVERDVDADGDDVLVITVVFSAKSKLDPARVVGLSRHIREKLDKREEKGFPIISFLSEGDARNRPIAATKLSDVLKASPPGKPINSHVVNPTPEPKPDFNAMQRVIQGSDRSALILTSKKDS